MMNIELDLQYNKNAWLQWKIIFKKNGFGIEKDVMMSNLSISLDVMNKYPLSDIYDITVFGCRINGAIFNLDECNYIKDRFTKLIELRSL